MRHVFIRDLVVECLIGIHKHEQRAKQRLRINLDIYVLEDEREDITSIQQVVCYDEIIQKIGRALTERHFPLLETASEVIAQICLADSRVVRVRVMLEKLDVYKNSASVGISVWRSRSTNAHRGLTAQPRHYSDKLES